MRARWARRAARPAWAHGARGGRTPRHLDRLAAQGTVGQTLPVGYGITPGSGPGHLALFGYDPLQFEVGRGVLEATGIDFELGPDDLAARGNFCTVDADGLIVDRRAGRVATEITAEICAQLEASITLPGVAAVRPPRAGAPLRPRAAWRGAERRAERDRSPEGRRPGAACRGDDLRRIPHRRAGESVRRRRPAHHGGPRPGQRPDPARLGEAARPAADARAVEAARGCRRRVPDVPRARTPRRHGRARRGRDARDRRSTRSGGTGTSTTSSSCTTSTPTPPARTATSGASSRPFATSMRACLHWSACTRT